jgi:hypothetical protein
MARRMPRHDSEKPAGAFGTGGPPCVLFTVAVATEDLAIEERHIGWISAVVAFELCLGATGFAAIECASPGGVFDGETKFSAHFSTIGEG